MSEQSLGMNGSRTRDFSDPIDAGKVLEQLGGEVFLKEKFPLVYDSYLRTVEKHKNKNLLRAGNGSDTEKNAEGLENGAFASAISLTAYQGKSSAVENGQRDQGASEGMITGATNVQGNEEWKVAYVSGYMKNVTDGTIIHSFGQRLDDTNEYESTQQRDSRDLNQFGNQTIQNYIECTAILKKDGTMESIHADSAEFILKRDSAPIVRMDISHPRSYKGNNPIQMMYARQPIPIEKMDYNYPSNGMIPGTDAVKTIVPVKGTITFSDDVIPLGYNAEITSQVPMLQYKGKGVCKYGYDQKAIASCFKISASNPQVVEFELNSDWNANLDISAYTGHVHQGDIALLFSFFIKTQIAGTSIIHNQSVSIYSTNVLEIGKQYYESVQDTNAYLPYIFICWGCFAKNTRIQLADKSYKLVSEIIVGDKLLGKEDKRLVVKSIVSGEEENMVCIETKREKTIQVSRTHPIETTEGVVRAQDIRPKMRLCCVDGTEDEVEFSYMIPYNDTVYSIVTEGGSDWVAAEEIWAGNFEMQNDNSVMVKMEAPVSEEVRQISEEFGQLITHLYE